ncbi:hypothetical protein PPNK14_12400 [Pectobacterium parmentieri]|uniref:Uncharacterized protein n=1 Tax=Pectobacterium parmentieri TaxID=1905730 RepID=A0A0H3I5M4_PECPM|nr:Hypothetical protein W5S_1963 [Pectobacterium parmentieri]POW27486.1 hypothetical protein PB20LOC_02131 [Pectobacterium parmentieri]
MTGIAQYDNQKLSPSFNVAVIDQGTPLYESGKPIPRQEARSGKSVAVLEAAI